MLVARQFDVQMLDNTSCQGNGAASRDVKIFFLIFDSWNQKFDFFSIIVYQPTQKTGSDRRQVRMKSPAVRRQRADVSMVIPSAPGPRDSV